MDEIIEVIRTEHNAVMVFQFDLCPNMVTVDLGTGSGGRRSNGDPGVIVDRDNGVFVCDAKTWNFNRYSCLFAYHGFGFIEVVLDDTGQHGIFIQVDDMRSCIFLLFLRGHVRFSSRSFQECVPVHCSIIGCHFLPDLNPSKEGALFNFSEKCSLNKLM